MEYFIFLFNVFLIILYSVSVALYFIAFLNERRKLYLWIAALFLFFIADNLILYMVDFIDGFARFYDAHTVTGPYIKSAVSIGIALCYLQSSANIYRAKLQMVDWLTFAVYIFLLLLIPSFPTTHLSYWSYFTISQLMFFFVVIRAKMWEKSQTETKQSFGQEFLQKNQFWKLASIMNGLVIIEDYIVIFFFDILEPGDLHIFQRSITEDIMSIYLSAIAIIFVAKHFVQRVNALPEKPDTLVYGENLKMIREAKIKCFCQKHCLTNRQIEVLVLILNGKSNLEIGELLCISEGTVKNHLHSIYTKTQSSGRRQITQMIEEMEYTFSEDENFLISPGKGEL